MIFEFFEDGSYKKKQISKEKVAEIFKDKMEEIINVRKEIGVTFNENEELTNYLTLQKNLTVNANVAPQLLLNRLKFNKRFGSFSKAIENFELKKREDRKKDLSYAILRSRVYNVFSVNKDRNMLYKSILSGTWENFIEAILNYDEYTYFSANDFLIDIYNKLLYKHCMSGSRLHQVYICYIMYFFKKRYKCSILPIMLEYRSASTGKVGRFYFEEEAHIGLSDLYYRQLVGGFRIHPLKARELYLKRKIHKEVQQIAKFKAPIPLYYRKLEDPFLTKLKEANPGVDVEQYLKSLYCAPDPGHGYQFLKRGFDLDERFITDLAMENMQDELSTVYTDDKHIEL